MDANEREFQEPSTYHQFQFSFKLMDLLFFSKKSEYSRLFASIRGSNAPHLIALRS